jgi:hypothetical protein
MEEQSSSESAERQVAEFVKNDEVGIGKPPRNLAGLPLVLFLFERVDEFDCGEEPYALAVMLDGLDADCRGQMRLPRAGAADQWSGPLGPDKRQAADLAMGRGLRSSNCCGLR